MNSISTARSLTRARQLPRPTREQLLRRDPQVHHFWNSNSELLRQAWGEWETEQAELGTPLPSLDASIFDPALRQAIEQTWKDPSKEANVRNLWKKVAPGVYQCQFFNPEKVNDIRTYLDRASDAGIPARPPYGIVLNRAGFMLDPRSEAHLAIPSFQTFYRNLLDRYMRPLGRLFFPEVTGYDTQSFGFSIRWEATGDQSIREHSDASSITLNINLNRPGEEHYGGSELYFRDPSTGEKHFVGFKPGTAVIHRGKSMHAALPITSGERSNIVLWLFGQQGATPDCYQSAYGGGGMSLLAQGSQPVTQQWSAQQRWSKPTDTRQDTYAPF